MPKIGTRIWPVDDRYKLYELGVKRATEFCLANDIAPPHCATVPKNVWNIDACAYYRAHRIQECVNSIRICLERCASTAGEALSRNWNWPATLTDREPYGVICHELGHHCDVWMGNKLKLVTGKYSSNFARIIQKYSGYEDPLTSYCPDPGEWFAEMFRLFVTNAYLLARVRPKTFVQLRKHFTPVSNQDWTLELGSNVPQRIIDNVRKKL